MKKITLVIFAFISFSCQALSSEQYTVAGQITNNTSTDIFLEKLSHSEIKVIDSSHIDAKGNFKMQGNIDSKGLYRLRAISKTSDNQFFWLLSIDPGENISCMLDEKNPTSFTITGNKNQEDFQTYIKASTSKQLELQQLYTQYQSIAKGNPNSKDAQSLATLIQTKSGQFNQMTSQSMANTQNIILKYFIVSNYLQQIQSNVQDQDYVMISGLTESLKKELPNSVYTSDFEKINSTLKTQKQQVLSGDRLKVGAQAPDLELISVDGKKSKISSYKGKVVLLDFWASWCRPCRQENPNVVKAYKKYSPKGFVVLSISQDQNLDNWKSAIKQDGLTWNTHFADKEIGNIATQTYNIQYIPKTYLLDKSGKIVATDVRGPALEAELDKLLK